MKKNLPDKIYRKLHYLFWQKLHPGRWSLLLYLAYWKYLFASKKNIERELGQEEYLYLTQEPNKGAGIGHQMGNWNSGYWFSQRFGVKYAYSSFSNAKWDAFLGFGVDEVSAKELVKSGYKKRRLPYFDETSEKDMALMQGMIDAYRGQKVVFFLELDQFYEAQYGAMEFIKKKYHQSNMRQQEKLIYDKKCLNIAVHIRRGDIVVGQSNQDPALTKRWVTTEYYAELIKKLVSIIPQGQEYKIYLFSQGNKEDFPELSDIKNLVYCLDMGAMDSFAHMVKADMLLTSKSSFSYKPALLSEGIKICPMHFWHGYPKQQEWVLVDEEAGLTLEQMEQLKNVVGEQLCKK